MIPGASQLAGRSPRTNQDQVPRPSVLHGPRRRRWRRIPHANPNRKPAAKVSSPPIMTVLNENQTKVACSIGAQPATRQRRVRLAHVHARGSPVGPFHRPQSAGNSLLIRAP
jgi:hypothetical protein